jgi:glucosylceramidase
MVQYFAKYVDAFKDHGVTVNGLTLMNEPLNSQGGYPCKILSYNVK